LVQRAIKMMSRRETRTIETGEQPVSYRWAVYAACALLAVACNYILGKDMAWDTMNYHLYSGFSAVNDRFDQDYFAAGVLSYFNPYAYAPFYAMVHAGLPALLICSILAVLHSVILWLTFELGVAVCPSKNDRSRLLAGGCAVALAFMNPVLMQELGSCFADITTAELSLAGWLFLASAVREPRKSRVIWAGLILGAASAFKLSNAVPAISAAAMLFVLPMDWRDKIRHGFLFGIALGAGFAVVAAPWSYRLEKVFGNPMFPMFNNIFRSPEFITQPMVHYRFIPQSIGDALWRPFAMIDPTPMIHEELSAPDPRYAILVALGVTYILLWAWKRFSRTSKSPNDPEKKDSTRVLCALGLALSLHWVLWLATSGNSRYVLTMACVAAAVIVGMLFRIFASRPNIRNYLLIIILGTQAVQLSMGAQYRWNSAEWGGPWFDLSIPENLKSEPNLYLTMGVQSNSFLAPFLAKGSGFVNFAGGFTLDPDDANGTRLKTMIRRSLPNVRVVFGGGERYKNAAAHAPNAPEVDDALQRFGLRTDMNDCATITIHGLSPPLEIRYKSSVPVEPQSRDTTYLVTCRVVPDTSDRSALIARQREVDLVFDRLEDACPKLFKPHRLVTIHEGDVWRRLYGSNDISAWISHGRLKFTDTIRPNGVHDIGAESDWAKAPLRLDCGIVNGVSFAHIMRPN
jgi:hypothetical protein